MFRPHRYKRNAKRNLISDYRKAIAEWEKDLKYLYHQYYESAFGFSVVWPDTVVR